MLGSFDDEITDMTDASNMAQISRYCGYFGVDNKVFFSIKNIGPYFGLSAYLVVPSINADVAGTAAFRNSVDDIVDEMTTDPFCGFFFSTGFKLPLANLVYLDFESSYDPFTKHGAISLGFSVGFGKEYLTS